MLIKVSQNLDAKNISTHTRRVYTYIGRANESHSPYSETARTLGLGSMFCSPIHPHRFGMTYERRLFEFSHP